MDNKTTQRISKIFTGDELLRFSVPASKQSLFGFRLPDRICRWMPFCKHRTFKLKPMIVGTMYRMACHGQILEDVPEMSLLSIADHNSCINILRDTAALLLNNSEDLPDQELIDFIENNFTLQDIGSIVINAVIDTGINDVYEFYELLSACNKETDVQKSMPKRSDLIPHRGFGQILAYFKGAFSEIDLKWRTTWNNYMLYMASIAGPSNGLDGKPEKIEYKKLEPANWC